MIMSNDSTESTVEQCLKIIEEHVQMRESTNGCVNTMKNPKYLPRKEIITMLFSLIAKSNITIEQVATQVLLQAVNSASGNEGCATVTGEEIDCLLQALLSDSNVIRLAGLNSLQVLVGVLTKVLSGNVAAHFDQRIYIAMFDPDEKCAAAALDLWTRCKLETSSALCFALLKDIDVAGDALRASIAGATESLLKLYPANCPKFITDLISVYRRNNQALPAVLDAFGMNAT